MAAITITAADVAPGSGANLERCTAGEAFTAGQAVYQLSTDGKIYKADANDTAKDELFGIAVTSALAAGTPCVVQRGGAITIGNANVVAGTIYVLGATAAGDIAPAADLTTGWARCIIGVASTTSVIQMQIFNSGVIG